MSPASPERATSAANRWPRDVWFDAVWDCETLNPAQRAVAYAYGRYAGSGDITWCTEDELRKRTGIPSRNGIWLARKGLIDAGWLKETQKARQHLSAKYKLMIPIAQMPPQGTSETPVDNSDAPTEGIPDAPTGDPDAPTEGPISQTDPSELKRLGRAAPGPRREPTPSGPSTDSATSPAKPVNDQTDLATQLTTRGRAENVVEFAKPRKRTS